MKDKSSPNQIREFVTCSPEFEPVVPSNHVELADRLSCMEALDSLTHASFAAHREPVPAPAQVQAQTQTQPQAKTPAAQAAAPARTNPPATAAAAVPARKALPTEFTSRKPQLKGALRDPSVVNALMHFHADSRMPRASVPLGSSKEKLAQAVQQSSRSRSTAPPQARPTGRPSANQFAPNRAPTVEVDYKPRSWTLQTRPILKPKPKA